MRSWWPSVKDKRKHTAVPGNMTASPNLAVPQSSEHNPMYIGHVLVGVRVILFWGHILSLGMNVSELHVYSVLYRQLCNFLLFTNMNAESPKVDPKRSTAEPLIPSFWSRWSSKSQGNSSLAGAGRVLCTHSCASRAPLDPFPRREVWGSGRLSKFWEWSKEVISLGRRTIFDKYLIFNACHVFDK